MHYSPVPLHIPDNYLTLSVAIICWVITVLILRVAILRTNKSLGEKQIPLMGVMAAFIFAAQMINFPVIGGTSGHLLGGVLAAIVLGPWSAMLVMTAVIALQALLFQDGGLLVMGANILNMGLITAAIGYGLYRGANGRSRAIKLATAGFAAWLSVIAGALATTFQLWLSGVSDLQPIAIAMLSIHALIGIGEALITTAALNFILQTRPDILDETSATAQAGRGWVVVGILISLTVILLAPFASASPDGLERVANDLGFLQLAQDSPYEILPDYTVPFLGDTPLSTLVAGAVGALAVLALTVLAGRALQSKS